MLLGSIDPSILTGPEFTSSPRFPEGARSDRYENEDVLEAVGITTGADSLAGELALAEMDGAAEDAAFGGASELTRMNAITTASTATALPVIVQKSARPRCIGPPRRSRLTLGKRNIPFYPVAPAQPDSRRFWTVAVIERQTTAPMDERRHRTPSVLAVPTWAMPGLKSQRSAQVARPELGD